MTATGGYDRRAFRLWAPVALYAAAIFGLSEISNPPAPPGALTDKHLHAMLYAGLALLVLRALCRADPRRVTLACSLGAAALATGYGLTDELHQWFVPGRTADLFDALANAIGALGACLAVWAITRWTGRAALGSSASQMPEVP